MGPDGPGGTMWHQAWRMDFKDKANLIPFQAGRAGAVGLEETSGNPPWIPTVCRIECMVFPSKSSIFEGRLTLPCLITRGCRSCVRTCIVFETCCAHLCSLFSYCSCWCSSSGGVAHTHTKTSHSHGLPTMGNDAKRCCTMLYSFMLKVTVYNRYNCI